MWTALHEPETLEEWARVHLFYELQQVAGTAVLVARDDKLFATLGTATWISNAIFESHLAHLRVLDDFLRWNHEPATKAPDKPSRTKDVLAVDYVPTFTPTGFLLDHERDEINVRLVADHSTPRAFDRAVPSPHRRSKRSRRELED
jgi:hypothetical protein